MASKEWLLTKIIGTIIGIISLITVCISGANVVVQLRSDVYRLDKDIASHRADDVKQWDRAWSDIDDNTKAIHQLELQSTRIETNQKEIIRRLDEILTNTKKD